MVSTVVNLKEKASLLEDFWSPRVVGAFDDNYVKVARLKGTLAWHKHDDEDELFLVLDGRLRIEFEDGSVELGPGEMVVVPKGVMHNPVADEECRVVLLEKKSTRHTGELELDATRSVADQLEPL